MKKKTDAHSSNRPSIVLISYDFLPDRGPLARIASEIAKLLSEKYSVTIYSRYYQGIYAKFNSCGSKLPRNDDGNSFTRKLLSFLYFELQALKTLCFKRDRSEVIICFSNPPLLDTFIGSICRLRKFKFVVILQELYPNLLEIYNNPAIKFLLPILKCFRNFSLRGASKIVCISEDTQNLLEVDKIYNSTIIENWFKAEDLQREEENSAEDQEGIRSSPFIIRYGGNLGFACDLEAFERALHNLNKQTSDQLKFVFSANGYKLFKLQQLAEKYTSIDMVESPPVDHINASALNSDAHLILTPAKAYGCVYSSKLYFSIALEKVIIAFGPSESSLLKVVTENGLGFAAAIDQPQAMAKCLEDALAHFQDKEAWSKIKENLRKFKMENDFYEKAKKSYLELIENIVQA